MATNINPNTTNKRIADRNWEILAQEYPNIGLIPNAKTEHQHIYNFRMWKEANPTSTINPNPHTTSGHKRNWQMIYEEIV